MQSLCASLVSLGMGREAADAAALVGDATLLEKVWQDTGCLPEAALHAQVRTGVGGSHGGLAEPVDAHGAMRHVVPFDGWFAGQRVSLM